MSSIQTEVCQVRAIDRATRRPTGCLLSGWTTPGGGAGSARASSRAAPIVSPGGIGAEPPCKQRAGSCWDAKAGAQECGRKLAFAVRGFSTVTVAERDLNHCLGS